MLGVTFRRATRWWKGDGFSVVVSSFKAHLSLLLTDMKSLDYNLHLLELSFGYANTEKIRQAITFYTELELCASNFMYF